MTHACNGYDRCGAIDERPLLLLHERRPMIPELAQEPRPHAVTRDDDRNRALERQLTPSSPPIPPLAESLSIQEAFPVFS